MLEECGWNMDRIHMEDWWSMDGIGWKLDVMLRTMDGTWWTVWMNPMEFLCDSDGILMESGKHMGGIWKDSG